MDEPKLEEVLRYIYDLYDNPDISSKEKASKWLTEFQKSVNIRSAFYKTSEKYEIFCFLDFFMECGRSASSAK